MGLKEVTGPGAAQVRQPTSPGSHRPLRRDPSDSSTCLHITHHVFLHPNHPERTGFPTLPLHPPQPKVAWTLPGSSGHAGWGKRKMATGLESSLSISLTRI